MTEPPIFFQALADATRWEVVCRLSDGPQCVCDLQEGLGVPQSTLSTHLQVLRACGVLRGERRGRWMFYSIAPEVLPLLKAVWSHFPAGHRKTTVVEAGCSC